jgi:glycosyltransferase involved in cell wall biosynthesis
MNLPPITLVTPWYGHFAGGAEVAARGFAEQLAARGFQVQVLTTCCRSPFESWWQDVLPAGTEMVGGVTVRRFPVDREGERPFHELVRRHVQAGELTPDEQRAYLLHSINSRELVDYAARHVRDHLVICMPYTQGLVYSTTQALHGRATVMPCLHDEPMFYWITTEEMMTASRKYFFFTPEEKALAVRQFGGKLGRRLVEAAVVGIGVELPFDPTQQQDEQARVRNRYRLPEHYFVYMGRKDPGKNLRTLVEYFRAYRRKEPTAWLVFVGGGLEELVPREPGFLDLGYLPERDKYLVLAQARGLINLCRLESFSLVIMEAWLCGVPVVVDAGGTVTAAHCRRSGGGQVVSDSDEFAEALDALSCPDMRTALGEAGARYVRTQYAWDHVLNRLLREVRHA